MRWLLFSCSVCTWVLDNGYHCVQMDMVKYLGGGGGGFMVPKALNWY